MRKRESCVLCGKECRIHGKGPGLSEWDLKVFPSHPTAPITSPSWFKSRQQLAQHLKGNPLLQDQDLSLFWSLTAFPWKLRAVRSPERRRRFIIKSLSVFSTWIRFEWISSSFETRTPSPSTDEPPCDQELIASAGPAEKVEFDTKALFLFKILCVLIWMEKTWTDCMAGGWPGKSGSQSEEFEKSQRSRWGCHRIAMLYEWRDYVFEIKKRSWTTCSAGCKLPHTLVEFTTQLTELQKFIIEKWLDALRGSSPARCNNGT